MQVSIFTNVYSGIPQESTLEDIIFSIKSSKRLKKSTSKVRKYLNEGLMEKAVMIKKGSLPAFVPAAQLLGGKGHDNIVSLTGLCFIDIDKISEEEIQRVREIACNDEHTVMVKQSVSGHGIHIFIRYILQSDKVVALCGLSPREMKNKYIKICKAIHHYYRGVYKIKIDKTSTNPCQLCIISADSDVYYNPSAKPLIYNESSKTIIP